MQVLSKEMISDCNIYDAAFSDLNKLHNTGFTQETAESFHYWTFLAIWYIRASWRAQATISSGRSTWTTLRPGKQIESLASMAKYAVRCSNLPRAG